MKKYLHVLIIYLLVTFTLAYLFNEVLFKQLFSSMLASLRETPIFPLGFVTMILQTVVIYILYSRYFEGQNPFRESLMNRHCLHRSMPHPHDTQQR